MLEKCPKCKNKLNKYQRVRCPDCNANLRYRTLAAKLDAHLLLCQQTGSQAILFSRELIEELKQVLLEH